MRSVPSGRDSHPARRILLPLSGRMRHRRLWLYSLILLALNLFLAARLFKLEYGQYMGSIEGTFIGLANVLMHHPGELRWFPTWMAGIPFDNTYLPLLHLIAAAFGRLSGRHRRRLRLWSRHAVLDGRRHHSAPRL